VRWELFLAAALLYYTFSPTLNVLDSWTRELGAGIRLFTLLLEYAATVWALHLIVGVLR
jgi:hypothetical protein